MELSLEEKRQVASLVTVKGYQVLLDKVLEWKKDQALTRMKAALSDEKLQFSYEFCAWDEVLKTLRGFPEQQVQILKEEKDEVYG